MEYGWLNLARGITVFSVVLMHVALMLGAAPDRWFLLVRDWTFPVIVLSSFFGLTLRSVSGSHGLAAAVRNRITRVLVPSLVWTAVYWYAWEALIPLLIGRPPLLAPRPTVYLFAGGFMHLWYLQFLFLGSVGVLLLVQPGASKARTILRHPAIWLGAAFVYAIWLRDPLLERFAPIGQPGLTTWFIFKRQSLIHAAYVPAGVGIGLLSASIRRAGHRPGVRRVALVVAVAAIVTYPSVATVRWTREILGLVVFTSLILQTRVVESPLLLWVSRYSYAVYILHYGIAQCIVLLVSRMRPSTSGLTIVATSFAAMAASLAAAVLFRRLCPIDWLLPVVRNRTRPPPNDGDRRAVGFAAG